MNDTARSLLTDEGTEEQIPVIVEGLAAKGERYRVESDLVALLRPVGTVRPHPRNPRQGDIGAISVSLTEFAQYKPIVVQVGTGYILAGNHTYQAATMLGWTHIAMVRKDCDEATATALMLADNRTSDLGVYDDAVLLELARTLDEDLLAASGYDYDILDDLARSVGQEPTPRPGEFPTLEEKAEKYLNNSIRQLNIHFAASEFEGFIARLQAFMDTEEIDTNTDAIIRLLTFWEEHQGGGGEEESGDQETGG